MSLCQPSLAGLLEHGIPTQRFALGYFQASAFGGLHSGVVCEKCRLVSSDEG